MVFGNERKGLNEAWHRSIVCCFKHQYQITDLLTELARHGVGIFRLTHRTRPAWSGYLQTRSQNTPGMEWVSSDSLIELARHVMGIFRLAHRTRPAWSGYLQTHS